MMKIDYPYLPPGHHLKYVSVDHPFMVEASHARETCAGDSLYPVGVVLVKEGVVLARAGNGFNKGPGNVHVCPRVVLNTPSGTGYDLCRLHDAPGHAEQMLIQEALRLGVDTQWADVYLYGHWWACEPCWNVLLKAGVRDLYVTDDAHERFSRDRVYAQTLSPSITSVSLEGFEGELLDEVRQMLLDLGLEYSQKKGDVHCRLSQMKVQCVLSTTGECLYTLEQGDLLVQQLKNVLRQL